VLQALSKDRVQDLRFRACHGLKLGITSFPVLRLRAKSESVNLPDALPVSELAEFDLQAPLRRDTLNRHRDFEASFLMYYLSSSHTW